MVEDDIVKHYRSEDGIWLVEKGKIKEAKLLKEAYERIVSLRKDRNHYVNLYNSDWEKLTIPIRKERDDLRVQLEEQKKINKKLLEKYSSIKNAVAEIELLGDKVDV